jgi:hypothetical protein
MYIHMYMYIYTRVYTAQISVLVYRCTVVPAAFRDGHNTSIGHVIKYITVHMRVRR